MTQFDTQSKLCIVNSGGSYGMVNFDGEYIVNPQYKDLMFFSAGILFKNDKDKIGFLDWKGKEIVPAKFKGVRFEMLYKSKYAAVSTSGSRWQVVDEKGETVIPAKYDLIMPLTSELFSIKKDDKWGLADVSKGEICCNPQFKEIKAEGKVLFAQFGDNFAIINREGKILSEEIYRPKSINNQYSDVRTQFMSAEQLASFINRSIKELPISTNTEEMAGIIGKTRYDFQPNEIFTTLRYMDFPGMSFIITVTMSETPIYVKGYKRTRTWNSNSRPLEYEIILSFNDTEKGKAVRSLLANKYNIQYTPGTTEADFNNCYSFELKINAQQSDNCTMRVLY